MISEATNLQAFQTALAVCTGQGAAYQSTNPVLDLAGMQLAFTDTHTGVDDFV